MVQSDHEPDHVCPYFAVRVELTLGTDSTIGAIPFSQGISACYSRVRSPLGCENSDAGQNRTKRDTVFAENDRRTALKDASHFYSDSVLLRHVSRPRGVLRIAWLRIGACRCSRTRKLRRRI